MADESIKVPIDGDTKGFDKSVEGMRGTISAASVAMGNMLADMGKKALSVFGNMVTSGDQFNQAINQMAASTGAVGDELDSMREAVKGVYADNFGESYEDAANAVAEVSKQTGLMGDALQSATEDAMALSDTFGFEVNESTRAASALMTNFGIDAEEAYNLIAVGAQNGADQNGDLLDTLNEYSAQYSALGLSAEQFTQSLISGAQSGAFSIDKVGDAVKEFNIRCKDGSESTAEGFDMIGMSADDMAQRFAAGGDTAQAAFFETVRALDSIADPVAKNQAAIDLFGTQFEDLQANLLPMLSNMEDASGVAYDALGQINEVKYDDISSAMEGLKRTIGAATLDIRSNLSAGLADAVGGFVNVLKSADGDAGKVFDGLVEAGKTALAAIEPVIQNWITKGKDIIDKIVTGIQDNMPLIQEKAKEILQALINGMMDKVSMIVEIGLPILQTLIQGIAEHATELAQGAAEMLTGLVAAIQEALPVIIPAGIQILTSLVQAIVEALPTLGSAAIDIINALISGLTAALSLLIEYLPEIITAIVTFITTNLTPIIEAAIQIIMALLNGILDNLDLLISAAVDLVFALVDALVDNLDPLIDAALQIIDSLIDYLLEDDNLQKLITMGLTLVYKIGVGIAKAAWKLLFAVFEIRDTLKQKFEEIDWWELGKQIIVGLIDGLKNGLSMIGDAVKDVGGEIWDGFKDFFGIHSPSRLMRDSIGKFLLPGVAVGMEMTTDTTAGDINRSLRDMMHDVDVDSVQMQLDSAVQAQGLAAIGTAVPAVQYDAPRESEKVQDTQQQGGDIIIPVNIGGTQLETVVVKAAMIANARSGGGTL